MANFLRCGDGEGETEDAAIADLKEAFRGYIETFGLDDMQMSPAEYERAWNL